MIHEVSAVLCRFYYDVLGVDRILCLCFLVLLRPLRRFERCVSTELLALLGKAPASTERLLDFG